MGRHTDDAAAQDAQTGREEGCADRTESMLFHGGEQCETNVEVSRSLRLPGRVLSNRRGRRGLGMGDSLAIFLVLVNRMHPLSPVAVYLPYFYFTIDNDCSPRGLH